MLFRSLTELLIYARKRIPWVQANLSKIIWALILVPGLLALYSGWRAGRKPA